MLTLPETNVTPGHSRFSRLIMGATMVFVVVAILAVVVVLFYGKDTTGNMSGESGPETMHPEFAEMLTAEELAAQKGEVYTPPKQTRFPEESVPVLDPEL